MSPFVARRVNSRQRSNSVAFGAKRTFREPRLPNRIYEYLKAQLANTSEQDVNMLTAWFGGWYNGLGHKHFIHFDRGELLEHEVIVYCREHPERRVLDALAVVFRDEQVAAGSEMRPMPRPA
jgi:hypothetical protein